MTLGSSAVHWAYQTPTLESTHDAVLILLNLDVPSKTSMGRA